MTSQKVHQKVGGAKPPKAVGPTSTCNKHLTVAFPQLHGYRFCIIRWLHSSWPLFFAIRWFQSHCWSLVSVAKCRVIVITSHGQPLPHHHRIWLHENIQESGLFTINWLKSSLSLDEPFLTAGCWWPRKRLWCTVMNWLWLATSHYWLLFTVIKHQ